MDKIFKVNVNKTLNFELNKQKIEGLNVVSETNSKYHILHNNQSFKAELAHSNFNKKEYTISLNSNTYQIKIVSDLDLLIEKMSYSTGSSKKINFINAPMPGIIIGLPVKEGDTIKKGDTLLVLEAMKMENAIICPKDAIVKSIFIQIGDAVEKSKLLIELE